MKKILIILLFSLLILSHCMLNTQKSSSEKVVVRFWHPFSTDSSLGKTLIQLIDQFNKEHPEWLIKPEGMGSYSILKQKLIASIIAGNQPELSLAYESWINKFYNADALISMDDLINNKTELNKIKKDLFKAFLQSCTIDGKLMSMPFNKSVPVLYYNKNMFKKYNIKRPPENWKEFILISKKLTKDINQDGKPDIWGIISRANLTDFLNFLKQNQGEILSSDEKKILFNQSTGMEALKFFISWKYVHGIADFYTGGNPYAYQNDFTAGRCGMIIGSCVSRFFMKKKLTFPLGTAPIFGHKKKAVLVYGTNIILFKKATAVQQKAGWEFIKWFTSPNITALWSKKTSYMPVRKSALKTKLLIDEFKKDPELKSSIYQLEYAFLEPIKDSWHLGRDYLSEAIDNILIDSEIGDSYDKYQKKEISKDQLEKVIEERAYYHLNRAATKMKKWMI